MALDLLLISPPVANVGQAAASISTLAAFLRSRGWAGGRSATRRFTNASAVKSTPGPSPLGA